MSEEPARDGLPSRRSKGPWTVELLQDERACVDDGDTIQVSAAPFVLVVNTEAPFDVGVNLTGSRRHFEIVAVDDAGVPSCFGLGHGMAEYDYEARGMEPDDLYLSDEHFHYWPVPERGRRERWTRVTEVSAARLGSTVTGWRFERNVRAINVFLANIDDWPTADRFYLTVAAFVESDVVELFSRRLRIG